MRWESSVSKVTGYHLTRVWLLVGT